MEISTVLQNRLNRFEESVLLKVRDGLIPGASAIHNMIVPQKYRTHRHSSWTD
jgi:hypothetical protein